MSGTVFRLIDEMTRARPGITAEDLAEELYGRWRAGDPDLREELGDEAAVQWGYFRRLVTDVLVRRRLRKLPLRYFIPAREDGRWGWYVFEQLPSLPREHREKVQRTAEEVLLGQTYALVYQHGVVLKALGRDPMAYYEPLRQQVRRALEAAAREGESLVSAGAAGGARA